MAVSPHLRAGLWPTSFERSRFLLTLSVRERTGRVPRREPRPRPGGDGLGARRGVDPGRDEQLLDRGARAAETAREGVRERLATPGEGGAEEALQVVPALGRDERIATVRADPEARVGTPYAATLLADPWRAAPKIQPPTTRVVDLTVGEEVLRANLKRKHRQYVNKAERAGIEIERFDGSTPPELIGPALADFNRIYQHTAHRAGFVARQSFYYERVWSIFAPTGRVRLSFAVRDGERVATLFHFTCGERAVESYGGMTDAGAEARANYLLKWAAIADFAGEGFRVYDMWGLATGGIRQFKEGFGGEEIEYVGARDLPLRAPIDAVLRVAIPAYGLAQRARLRVLGRDAGGEAAEGA